MKLQAKDLMVDDWVQVEAHRGFKSQKVKVITIPDYDDDNDYGHHYGCIGAWLQGGDNDFRDIKTSHLRPIPLTQEMLEKNGFRKRTYPNIEKHHQWIFCAGCTIMLWCCRLFDNADEGWMIDIDDAFCHSCRVHIKYLHELQHALKLCKIEKQIKL